MVADATAGMPTRFAGPRSDLGRLALRVLPLALVQNYAVGWALHYLHRSGPDRALAAPLHDIGGHGRSMPVSASEQFLHYLRDSTLALPVVFTVLLLVTIVVRALLQADPDTVRARLVFAAVAGLATAAASAPSVLAHGWLFDETLLGVALGQHLTEIALITLRYTFALALVQTLVFGVPWALPAVPSGGRPPDPRKDRLDRPAAQ